MLKSNFLAVTLLAAGSLVLLSACGTTAVGLRYATPASLAKAPPPARQVAVDSFIDARGEPATYLGAIRGGFGQPLKTLESDRPAAEVVKAAFSDALKARGVRVESSASPWQLSGVIRKLDCNQYVRREGNVEIELVVRDAGGKQRFVRSYSASKVDGSVVSLNAGWFGSVDNLRLTLEQTLREAVDKALDDPALRAALQ
jgi:hypothetical protein